MDFLRFQQDLSPQEMWMKVLYIYIHTFDKHIDFSTEFLDRLKTHLGHMVIGLKEVSSDNQVSIIFTKNHLLSKSELAVRK